MEDRCGPRPRPCPPWLHGRYPFQRCYEALTPTGPFATGRGSLIHVTRTSKHSISYHRRTSASRVHSLCAGSAILLWASLLHGQLASPADRTEFTLFPLSGNLVTDCLFISSCSPPGVIAPTQLLSITGLQCRPGRDFHPAVQVGSQAHHAAPNGAWRIRSYANVVLKEPCAGPGREVP